MTNAVRDRFEPLMHILSGNRLVRLRQSGDEGAAMMIALFVIATVMTLSVTVAGIVIAQSAPTQYSRKHNQTLAAAEGGLDAGLARIRQAVSSGTTGAVTKLPCTTTHGAVLTGSLGPDQGGLAYTTTITYYSTDPTNVVNRTTANQVTCSASGTPATPAYALIQSTGSGTTLPNKSASTGNRSIQAVYNFSLTNANISGGPIPLMNTTYCIDAGATPAVGTFVTMLPCVTGQPSQSWSYNTDLTISLTGMLQGTLCLYASNNTSTSTKISLATCNGGNKERWSFNEAGEYEGTDTANPANYNGYCFVSSTNPSPAINYITLTTTCNSGHDTTHTWAPSAKVGAGQAGAGTNQLVNYQEFGRCLDDTGWDVNAAFLIDYPCKQTPNKANIDQNQIFTGPNSNKQMVMSYNPNNGGPYCLQAGTAATPTTGTIVLIKVCSSSQNLQKWTFTGDSGDNSTNYNYKTTNGLCLGLSPAPASDTSTPWSRIDVETCNGSYEQKWNAPPLSEDAVVDNLVETTS
jgi:Tfp pilus assembly protein PilX